MLAVRRTAVRCERTTRATHLPKLLAKPADVLLLRRRKDVERSTSTRLGRCKSIAPCFCRTDDGMKFALFSLLAALLAQMTPTPTPAPIPTPTPTGPVYWG